MLRECFSTVAGQREASRTSYVAASNRFIQCPAARCSLLLRRDQSPNSARQPKKQAERCRRRRRFKNSLSAFALQSWTVSVRSASLLCSCSRAPAIERSSAGVPLQFHCFCAV